MAQNLVDDLKLDGGRIMYSKTAGKNSLKFLSFYYIALLINSDS